MTDTAVGSHQSPPELPDWPEQRLRGHSLDGHRYTTREFAEREWEHMWTKVWLLLGREDEMPNPGDWQQEEVGRESILMVRQDDGGIVSAELQHDSFEIVGCRAGNGFAGFDGAGERDLANERMTR